MKKTIRPSMLRQGTPPPSTASMIGKQFGRFLVEGFAGFRGYNPYVNVTCECGSILIANAHHVLYGRSRSCGCYRIDHPSRLKHGYAPLYGKQPRVYVIWKSMNDRCRNPKNNHFKYYGGRGIDVCVRWSGEHGFENFLADMGEPNPGMSIERMDNNCDYSPKNCKWIPRRDQAKNRLYNWTVSLAGETMTAREATRRLGVSPSSIDQKLRERGYRKGVCVPLESIL